MSHSLAASLHRIERASVAYLVLACFLVSGVLAAEWVKKATAALDDGLVARPYASMLEDGGGQ